MFPKRLGQSGVDTSTEIGPSAILINSLGITAFEAVPDAFTSTWLGGMVTYPAFPPVS
jgi:hypothetical protein